MILEFNKSDGITYIDDVKYICVPCKSYETYEIVCKANKNVSFAKYTICDWEEARAFNGYKILTIHTKCQKKVIITNTEFSILNDNGKVLKVFREVGCSKKYTYYEENLSA